MGVIVYSYYQVVVAVKKSRESLVEMGKSSLVVQTFRRHKRHVKNYETAKIGMKLITLFILSWGPYACVAFIAQFVNPHITLPLIQLIPVVMAKSASVWNPIVYAISHCRFKKELRGLFLEKCCPVIIMSETSSGCSASNCSNRNHVQFKVIRNARESSSAV